MIQRSVGDGSIGCLSSSNNLPVQLSLTNQLIAAHINLCKYWNALNAEHIRQERVYLMATKSPQATTMENLNQNELCVLDYLKDKLNTDVQGQFNFASVSKELGLDKEELKAILISLEKQNVLDEYLIENDMFTIVLSI